MNNTEDEFDVVIKINKIDDFRLRPKRNATTSSEPSTPKKSVSSVVSRPNPDSIEGKIYSIIEKKKAGIKAKDIADKLRMSRKDVNHYLYGVLSRCVHIDKDFKWYVSFTEQRPNSPSLKQGITHNEIISNEISHVNFEILKQEAVATYINMFDKLVVSHREGLSAPHKYILLISVFTLIGNGVIRSNTFGSSKEIEDEFNKTWNRIVPKGTPFNSMYTTPFWHLASERFWNVYTSDDKPVVDIWNKPIMSINRQRKELTAVIDLKLYNLIVNNETRRAIIAHLENIIRKGLKIT